MTVVLLVLKIIGIVLLVLLAILLLLLLLALFVPVRYRAKGQYTDKPDVCGSVYWLFHIVSFRFAYREDELTSSLRIFGIRWKRRETDDDDIFDDAEEIDDDEFNEAGESSIDESNHTEKMNDVRSDRSGIIEDEADHEETDENGRNRAVNVQNESENYVSDTPPRPKHRHRRRKKPHISIKQRISGIILKIREKISSIKRLFRRIGDLKKKIEGILKDPACRKAFDHLKKELFLLLKRIAPKKMKLTAEFSTGSPDTTGEALGVLAMFPVAYKNRWKITPDFESEEFYIRADFEIRGRIFVFRILGIVLRIIFDKNCRKLYHKLTK